MFYPYKQRMDKLGRISRIEDKTEKKEAVDQFINEEMQLLSDIDKYRFNQGLSPACLESPALKSARKMLISLEAQVGLNHLALFTL